METYFNLLTLLFIIMLFSLQTFLIKRIKNDIQFKKDMIFCTSVFILFSIMISVKLHKLITVEFAGFSIGIFLFIMGFQLIKKIMFYDVVNNTKINFRVIFTSVVAIILIFTIGNVYSDPKQDFNLKALDINVYIILITMLFGIYIEHYLRKNYSKLFNLRNEEYYHQPISKVSEITYYQNIPKNISPGLSLARFYKCEIEEDYWNYWKKKLPVEMEKYKNREETISKAKIEVYKFINAINKCKKKIDDLFNSEVYPTIKFALDNNLYAIAAEKNSDIIPDFEELRKDIQTTIAESDSMIASCNKFIQEIESNKKDNVFFFTIDYNINDYKLHINNKYNYFNRKITIVRKAKKEFDFLLTGKRNRKLETINLNEKDIDNISKNFLQ